MKEAKMVEVVQNLFVGPIECAFRDSELVQLGIGAVVNASFSKYEYRKQFRYLTIDLLDSPDTNIAKHFSSSNSFIHSHRTKGIGVYVHCQAGRSRSVTLVIAYLIKHLNMPLGLAMSLVKSKNSWCQPNEGFLLQLQCFEERCADERQMEMEPDVPATSDTTTEEPSQPTTTPQPTTTTTTTPEIATETTETTTDPTTKATTQVTQTEQTETAIETAIMLHV